MESLPALSNWLGVCYCLRQEFSSKYQYIARERPYKLASDHNLGRLGKKWCGCGLKKGSM